MFTLTLSRRSKEAIKTALAMTIAYAISLQMGWDHTMWAAFVVAFISLQTVGQSINKAAMRMFGTLVAMTVALTFIAFFAQERWLFMVFLSAWLGLCVYMMAGKSNQYFWQICGFVCVIICMDAGPDPVNAFDTAVMRAQQNALGILVYSLVAIFLWPNNSRGAFEAATFDLASIQHALFQTYTKLILHKVVADNSDKDVQQSRQGEMQALNKFQVMLDAAKADSYDISENRVQWEFYSEKVKELGKTLEQWRQSFSEVQSLDMYKLVNGIDAYVDELDIRLTQIQSMLGGNDPDNKPQSIELAINQRLTDQLSHFEKASITVFVSRLKKIERISRDLFVVISNIRGFSDDSVAIKKQGRSVFLFSLDVDRLSSALRLVISVWVAYLAIIYMGDIPGGMGFISLLVPIGMVLVTMPQLQISTLLLPLAFSIIFSSILYIFVMPKLSSFMALGVMIFSVTFIICYLFAAPQKMVGRAFGLALFITITGISNEQTYSFFVVSTTSLEFVLIFLLFAFSAYIPFSPQAEKTYMRLLTRFFRCSYALLSIREHSSNRIVAAWQLWKRKIYLQELNNLPAKLSIWEGAIDQSMRPDNPQQLQSLAMNLQVFSYQLQELLEIREHVDSGAVVQNLLRDVQYWQHEIQQVLQKLFNDPASGDSMLMRERLSEIVTHMEDGIKETLNQNTGEEVSRRDSERFYLLLGAFRGMSEALVGYSDSAEKIKWSQWQEQRF